MRKIITNIITCIALGVSVGFAIADWFREGNDYLLIALYILVLLVLMKGEN